MSIKAQSPVRPCPQQLGARPIRSRRPELIAPVSLGGWDGDTQGQSGGKRGTGTLHNRPSWSPPGGGGGGTCEAAPSVLTRWANALTPPSPSLQVERAGAAGRPPLPLHRARVPAQHRGGQPAPHRPPLPGAEPQGRGHRPAARLIPVQPAPPQW